MTLRSRLVASLLTIAVVFILPLVISIRALDHLHREARQLREGEFAASLLLGRLREALGELQRRETALFAVHDVATRDAMHQQLQGVRHLTDSLELYDLDASVDDVRQAIRDLEIWAPREYAAALAGRGPEADTISASHIVPALARADRGVLGAERALRQRTASRLADAAVNIARAKNLSVVVAFAALALAALVGVVMTRYISRPVRELERGMQAVADGDFTYKLPLSPQRRDEFGRLAMSFDQMAKQLAELDKLKAEFVSVASHELKTPINVVLGYLQLLDEGIYGPLAPQQRDVHRTLETQVKSLSRLVQQLLDISRFEAGGSKIDARDIELATLLGHLEDAFHVLAVQRGVRFIVHRDDALPATVRWDADRVSEVLGNLLSNAFKFTDRGGEVELRASAVDSSVVLVVRDTGAGIDRAQLPHIFQKFFQADNQQKASAKGSGLGLAIAKSIVEAHHGSIDCESTPGVGTTFTVVLPVHVAMRRTSLSTAIPAEIA